MRLLVGLQCPTAFSRFSPAVHWADLEGRLRVRNRPNNWVNATATSGHHAGGDFFIRTPHSARRSTGTCQRPRRMNANWREFHSLQSRSPNAVQIVRIQQWPAVRGGEHAIGRGAFGLPFDKHCAQRRAHRYDSLTRRRLRRLDQLAGLLVLNTFDVEHASVESQGTKASRLRK